LLTYKLNQVNKSFQIVLVGDGPDRSYLEAKLRDIVGINRLISLGKLHDVELQVAFRKIGVLVSLSQTESYGRTIRESIAYGVPVWGTHTSGLKQLNDEYASSGLEFINLADSPELLNIQFQQLLNSNIDENYGINIAVEDSRRISNLCKSWIEISSQERKVNLNDSE
jgi:glycosyltransferase involved in cell wall biosynthesis